MFGATLATVILTDLAKFELPSLQTTKKHGNMLQKMWVDLANRVSVAKAQDAGATSANAHTDDALYLRSEDMDYVVYGMFDGRSALSGQTAMLALTKWDARRPLRLDNVVLLTKEEMRVHERLKPGEFRQHYDRRMVEFVERKLREVGGSDVYWDVESGARP